jgi:hypothetical protein
MPAEAEAYDRIRISAAANSAAAEGGGTATPLRVFVTGAEHTAAAAVYQPSPLTDDFARDITMRNFLIAGSTGLLMCRRRCQRSQSKRSDLFALHTHPDGLAGAGSGADEQAGYGGG